MNAFEEIAYADGDTPLTGLALHPQGDARAAVAAGEAAVTPDTLERISGW